MTPYLNLHTHHSLFPGEATLRSVGLHPWHVTPCWEELLCGMLTPERLEQVDAIGECGLDALCDVPRELQEAAFRRQIDLSEAFHKPLIVHCVRAFDDIVRLHRGLSQPWIIHGFRGKPQQAMQLVRHGFYLSFGLHLLKAPQGALAESVKAVPTNRLFLETDDTPSPIAPLYAAVAVLRGTTPEQLRDSIWENAREL